MIELPVGYLLEVSKAALKDIQLRNLATSASSRKRVRSVLEEWIEARAQSMLIEWLIENGEELVLAVLEQKEKPLEMEAPAHEEKPTVIRATTFGHWRSERRYNQRKRSL